MAKRAWPKGRRLALWIAVCFLTLQSPADGRETEREKRVTRVEDRIRRFLGGFASNPVRTRRSEPDDRRKSRSDDAVRRTQADPPAPTSSSATSAAPINLDVPAAEEGVRNASPPPSADDGAGAPTSPVDLNLPTAGRTISGAAPPADTNGGAPPGPVDLNVPAANTRISAGLPTTAAARRAEATVDQVKRLQDLLGYEDAPVQIFGWIQNSYTGDANGTPRNGENFGVNPNRLANSWMGNQYYIVVENELEPGDEINFGFRADVMFGNDWQFNYSQGMLNNAFKLNSFAGVDFPQIYGQVHLPFLVKGGIDVKAGRAYSIAGYEQVPAIARPLLSVPYMFDYGQPFTHVGVLTIMHPTDRINLYNGSVNGWDRWIDQRYLWGYIGGLSWTSKSAKTTLASTVIWGPNQFPSQLPGNQQLYPDAYVNVPSIAGLPNPGYFRNDRTLFTTVVTHKWNDKLTQVMETDQGWERSIPGLASGGANGQPRSATWFSFGNWFLAELHPKITGVWRSEVFWDCQGARIQNMVNGQFVGDRYYEMTLGAIYKPNPNVWIRPEARYDWTQYHAAYNDDTRKSQFTMALDVILLW